MGSVPAFQELRNFWELVLFAHGQSVSDGDQNS